MEGFEKYTPDGKTASELLKEIKSSVIIDVVNLTIKNYGPKGYSLDKGKLGIDEPGLYSRINNHMVKAFYENIPTKNKGKYIEDVSIPHGFARDGNIQKNFKEVTQYVENLVH